MRLPAGIYLDNEETFGQLKFSALRREVYVQDAEGNPTDELKERTYDLRCRQHRCMVQVGIPGNVPEKDIEYGEEVVLINPVPGAVATVTGFNSGVADWYFKADDIVPKRALAASGQPVNRPGQSVQLQGQPQGQNKDNKEPKKE